MPYPTAFKYTKEHEWIKAEGNNATIGITSYAQDSLGDIVFVDTPKVGAEISACLLYTSGPANLIPYPNPSSVHSCRSRWLER